MFRFLDKKKEQHNIAGNDEHESLVAPGTEITYKKSLIRKYHEEHTQLQTFFERALTAYQLGKDEEFLNHLRNLQIALRKHLLDEELNLYIYLRHCYRNDKQKQDLITRFKKSSKKTGLTTFDFIKQLTEEGEAISRDESFLNRFLDIGNILETLLTAEEAHLYPIYRMPARSPELSV